MYYFRTTLFLLLLPCFLFSQQQLKKKTVAETNPTKVSFGLHIGLSSSDISANRIAFPATGVDLSRLDRQQATNGRFGLLLLIHLSEDYGLETGLIYEKLGLKAEGLYDPELMEYNLKNSSSTHFSFEYLIFPLLFKRNLPLQEKMQLSFQVGTYLALLQSSSYGFEVTDLIMNPDGSFRESMRKTGISLDDYSRKLDIGMRLQAGVERSISETASLFSYVYYSRGLRTIDDFPETNLEGGSEGMNRVWGLSFGGYFKMK
ncbi:MAG: hypothetical protein ACI8YQ_004381 [Polaribacter sp.]|jgi:hypothetical protein